MSARHAPGPSSVTPESLRVVGGSLVQLGQSTVSIAIELWSIGLITQYLRIASLLLWSSRLYFGHVLAAGVASRVARHHCGPEAEMRDDGHKNQCVMAIRRRRNGYRTNSYLARSRARTGFGRQ
jgi:hypothetical protein